MTGITYTEPLLCIFLMIGIVGVVRQWGRVRTPKPWGSVVGIAGLFLVTWPPADWLFSRPLEAPYQRLLSARDDADAIVVPATTVHPAKPHFPAALLDSSAYARCRYAAWLYHHWKRVPIVVSGGNLRSGHPPHSEAMAQMLQSEGVPGSDILQESRSLNTYQNAVYTAQILKARSITRIALVMEADNMLRGDLVFRKQQLHVIPAPFRHRSTGFGIHELMPSWTAVRRNETTLHELLGLAWYELRGWI